MKPRSRAPWLAAAAALLLALAFHGWLLGAVGSFLVNAGPPAHAGLVVVLAGDAHGDRIQMGADLVRQGYAPRVLVSGPSGYYGAYECDLAIPFAVRAGYPESYFLHAEHHALSTTEEARDLLPFVRKLGAHDVLLVTSDFHTRRAGRAFRRAAPDVRFTVVAAPGSEFSAQGWWHNRQGRKIAFTEWTKTIADWLGI